MPPTCCTISRPGATPRVEPGRRRQWGPNCRFTTERFGADDRVRTGDLNLGKVALYQLSYVREGGNCIGVRADHAPGMGSRSASDAGADTRGDLLGHGPVADLIDDEFVPVSGEDEGRMAFVLPTLHRQTRFEADRATHRVPTRGH